MRVMELQIDVTEAAAVGEPAHTAVTVFLPDPADLPPRPIVCFAFPGGGYSRRYYAFDMPGSAGGGQAGFHCARGWIVVACDHLGFGDSALPDDSALTLDNIAAANDATVREVMRRLRAGAIADDVPPLGDATVLGMGQSMGGCFTIVAQGQLGTFEGVALLGYSGIHTVVPSRPGAPAAVWPWVSRSSPPSNPRILNQAAVEAAAAIIGGMSDVISAAAAGEHPFQWAFHYDDEPADIVALDMAASAGVADPLPPWRSATTPSCGIHMVAPGAVALEAAAITVPVLVAVGERDVVPDPWAEPKAFKSARDITVFQCPRMGHMHNFASTREVLWRRIHAWGDGVAAMRA